MAIASVNPATGETLRKFEPLDEKALQEKLARAAAAFAQHRRTTFSARAKALTAAASLLETETETFARIITPGDGQTNSGRARRSEKVRRRLSLLREQRRRISHAAEMPWRRPAGATCASIPSAPSWP